MRGETTMAKRGTKSSPTIARSRNEAILGNMLGENNVILEPFSRIETLLLNLADKLSAIETMQEPFVINITATSATAGTSDKNASEIFAAVHASRKILVNVELYGTSTQGSLVPLIFSIDGEGDESISCVGLIEPDHILAHLFMPFSDPEGTQNAWLLQMYDLSSLALEF